MARVALVGASMRAGGARVGLRTLLRARRAARGAASPADAHDTLRAALCSRPGDEALFEVAYAEFLGRRRVLDGPATRPRPAARRAWRA